MEPFWVNAHVFHHTGNQQETTSGVVVPCGVVAVARMAACYQTVSYTHLDVYKRQLLFEHVADKHCLTLAIGLIASFCLVLITLIIANYWTGWFFSFQNGEYVRGPLNRIGYLVLFIEVMMLCACSFRNRSTVSPAMHLSLIHI